jgi:hypothetical protein
MDLVTVVLFQVLYYLRPQEWAGIFSTIHFVQIVMLAGVAGLFFREGGLRLADLFRTPHDWAVFAFWLWIVIASPHRWEAFKENANLFIFYIVIVQALRSVPRMKIFALCWTLLIVLVATLALATKWGFDPLESYIITSTVMKGRLILNLSIFDNPNGLGHSVVPAIPMIYYYFVWKRPITSRLLGFALLSIPLYCIYLTYSKGAFLCGAITILATMCFGRPKSVQILILVGAFLFGNVALYSLPRMNELDKSKSDQAIQGRVAAFKHGYGLLQTTFKGIGKGEWKKDPFITDYVSKVVTTQLPGEAEKNRVVKTVIHYNKAPHSSYVCIGGELGWPGLFFLVAVLYCCMRTTITARTATLDEERIRRIFFVLVLSYIVSSWMVDFEYRPTFFMFTAAIAALHRHLLGMLREHARETEPANPGLPVWHPAHLLPQPAFATGLPDASLLLSHEAALSAPSTAPETPSAEPRIGRNWNRFGWFDLGMILALTYAVVRFWAYIMYRM